MVAPELEGVSGDRICRRVRLRRYSSSSLESVGARWPALALVRLALDRRRCGAFSGERPLLGARGIDCRSSAKATRIVAHSLMDHE